MIKKSPPIFHHDKDLSVEKLREYYNKNLQMEETVSTMVKSVYPITIEDKFNQAKRGYELLDQEKVKRLMEAYTKEWEELLYEKFINLYLALGEKHLYQEDLLAALRYVECRCMLKLIMGDDKTGINLRDFAGKIIR
jgi:hypothetical protein